VSVRLTHTARRLSRGLADSLVTQPLLRWTWQGQGEVNFVGDLPDFRPSDRETVREMMAGRYLLASKLVETGGTSPFSIDIDHPDWWNNLQGFSWLRHFRDCRDPGERQFARTLVLDWIGREGQFDRDTWTLMLTAQRVLNWLRHLTLLLDGATPEQMKTIQRNLGTQVQSLRVRGGLADEPVEELFAAMGLLGAALCSAAENTEIEDKLIRLNGVLARQVDGDGLHLSRNPRLQLNLLVDLASLRRAATQYGSAAMAEFANRVDRMHEALDALTLSTGEPVYFNGCGQVPHDVLVAVQAHGPSASRRSQLIGGYGILRDGDSVVVVDSGLRPPSGFDGEAHAGALGFEFAHGRELILGSCGPAPSDLPESRALFRQAIAHSAPTIDAEDAMPLKGRLFSGPATGPAMDINTAEHMLGLKTNGYASRFGVEIERHLTLISGGTTLVGQDRVVVAGDHPKGHLAIRFHLGPGVIPRRPPGDSIVRLTLPDGSVWSFLWEGASLRQDDSVRQSAYLGFHRTQQLVLEADISADHEVAWIFTKEQ